MVLWAQILDSSVAEFILSGAEGLIRNDMSRFEIVTYRFEFSGHGGNLPDTLAGEPGRLP